MTRANEADGERLMRFDNRDNDKQVNLLCLPAGVHNLGGQRWLGVVLPDSWTDGPAEPKRIHVGSLVVVDDDGMKLGTKISEVPVLIRPTIIADAASAAQLRNPPRPII